MFEWKYAVVSLLLAAVSTYPQPCHGAPASSLGHSKPRSVSKRGLITYSEQVPAMANYPKITWDMNWWEGPPPKQPKRWTFLPELTHLEPDEYWNDVIKSTKHSESPYIAGFLEPDINNYDISAAVESWKANLEPLSKNFTLIPPIIGQNGLSWLQQFIKACRGCTFNGPIAFNVYVSSDAAGVADFKNHVRSMKAAFPGRELWIPNTGLLGDSGNKEWLMRRLIPLLDADDAITHYAWVGGDDFWDGKNLTPLAKLYATL